MDAWLSGPVEVAAALIQKPDIDALDIYPVSREVNNTRNDYASLIEPIASE
jgi:putative SOS response-associated peptidase YedK